MRSLFNDVIYCGISLGSCDWNKPSCGTAVSYLSWKEGRQGRRVRNFISRAGVGEGREEDEAIRFIL